MNRGTSNQAKLVIEKYLDILIGPSETYAKSIPQFGFLQELATIQLCNNHKKHHSHAIEQWLSEYAAKQASIITRLTEYYNLGIDDSYSGESEDSEDADDEQNTSISEEDTLEEGISTISSQSSSSLTFMRRTPAILAEDEVAKDVTWLLQQPIEKRCKKSGWIYIISPFEMSGNFKVGHTIEHHPQLERFIQHKKCYGEFKVLVTKLIPYAYRVEQLLLKELFNHQLQKRCLPCSKVHREILDVDQEILLRCLEKWIGFSESFPYSKQGVLTTKAKEDLPRPALKSYLGCKPTPRRSTGSTPKKKGGSQGAQSTPSSGNFKVSTSTAKDIGVFSTELKQHKLCSKMAEIQITPSKSENNGSTAVRYSMPGSFD